MLARYFLASTASATGDGVSAGPRASSTSGPDQFALDSYKAEVQELRMQMRELQSANANQAALLVRVETSLQRLSKDERILAHPFFRVVLSVLFLSFLLCQRGYACPLFTLLLYCVVVAVRPSSFIFPFVYLPSQLIFVTYVCLSSSCHFLNKKKHFLFKI